MIRKVNGPNTNVGLGQLAPGTAFRLYGSDKDSIATLAVHWRNRDLSSPHQPVSDALNSETFTIRVAQALFCFTSPDTQLPAIRDSPLPSEMHKCCLLWTHMA